MHPLLTIGVVPGVDSDDRPTKFTWQCFNFKPRYIDCEISFENFDVVSVNDDFDRLTLEFASSKYFRTKEG